jgi:hypothetical protein
MVQVRVDIYSVKVYGLYSFSKDTLKENGTSCLIKFRGHVFLGDVRHFII